MEQDRGARARKREGAWAAVAEVGVRAAVDRAAALPQALEAIASAPIAVKNQPIR